MATVASFPKRPGEEIRISLDEFHGNIRVNIRTWWQDDFGEWRPGKSGISLTPAHFREMWGVCHAVDAALKEQNL